MKSSRGYKVAYKGIVYNTAKECLSAYGVSESKYYRICSKMGGFKNSTVEIRDIDDIMLKVVAYSNSMDTDCDFKVNYNGRVYTSVIAYCKDSGFPFDVVIHRLKEGMTSEDSIKEVDYVTKHNFIFRGKQYKDIKTCLEEYKIPVSGVAIVSRMKNLRVTVQDAIEFHLSRMEEGAYDGFDYEGMHFSTLSEASRTLGLDIGALWDIKSKLKLTNTEVLDYAINKGRATVNSRRVEYRGVSYPNLTAVCLKYNLNVNKVRAYIAKNLDKSLKEVLDYFVDGARFFKINGTSYATLPDACNAIGITVSDVFRQRRLNPQMSLQDVLNMYSAKKEIE